MKINIRKLKITTLAVIALVSSNVYSGNPDRAGQAGASELLIMPYSRSNGWALANSSSIRGLEAMYLNVAGTAFTQSTEAMLSYTDWLKGSDININAFGFTQRVGETGVIGISVMSMNFGEIDITTVNQPEGGVGAYKPSLLNIGFSYAKAFSNAIFGGFVVKVIQESIADLSAEGVALDAGIQYVTGDRDRIKFGIALRNVGPSMRFDGDGLTVQGSVVGSTFDNQLSVQQRSTSFELPSLLNIGASYDIFLDDEEKHIIVVAGAFTSNSFQKDVFAIGLEYNFNNYLFFRAGYHYEDGIFKAMPERSTAYTGPAAGLSMQVPLNKEKGSFFSIDYSYRATNPYAGIHSIGAKISL